MKKRILMDLDELTKHCGHFVADTDLNNGYGCNHPDNEAQEKVSINENPGPFGHRYEVNENGKHKFGCCYCFVCPFGHIPYLADLKELDKDLYDEYKDDKPDDESEEDYLIDDNLIVVDDEDLIAKIEEK